MNTLLIFIIYFYFPLYAPLLLYRHRKEKAINENTTGKTVSRHELQSIATTDDRDNCLLPIILFYRNLFIPIGDF